MASLYPKKISGKTYWYLREMARVDGKPKMVSERYLGTAAEIAAAVEARQAAALPERTRQLEEISRRIALRVVEVSGVNCSSVALDMTNFATFTGTGNGKAPIAQRGKARQKRSDLRLVGLGLVVTRDGGIPLTWHAYPGDRPDVTQFTTVIDQLRGRYEAITAAAGGPSGGGTDMAVVFDPGQKSEATFAPLAGTGLRYVGSVPASDCPDLTALPASARAIVDQERFGGLTACDPRRVVYGTPRRGLA